MPLTIGVVTLVMLSVSLLPVSLPGVCVSDAVVAASDGGEV